jgi:hypothetical protein
MSEEVHSAEQQQPTVSQRGNGNPKKQKASDKEAFFISKDSINSSSAKFISFAEFV